MKCEASAGARRRRLHRSAGRARRASARCSSATSKATTSCSPARSARASTRSCCSISARRLDALEIPKPPFTRAIGLPRVRAHWVQPEIVVQVAIHRMDRARQAAPPAAARRAATTSRRARRRAGDAVITHPEKVLFPDDGITKGELAAYYEAIAPRDAAAHPRPAGDDGALPAGIGEKGFFQKNVVKGFPEWLERVEVPKKGGTVHHPLVTDTRSLLWLANQNCITPHVWTSRAPELYQPRHLRLRSRSVGRRARRAARRGARRCAICSPSSACRAG